jgi:hypothetical protein
MREHIDTYLLRCAKVNHLAQERDRKALESSIRKHLVSNRLAFRNIKVKPHGYEVHVPFSWRTAQAMQLVASLCSTQSVATSRGLTHYTTPRLIQGAITTLHLVHAVSISRLLEH